MANAIHKYPPVQVVSLVRYELQVGHFQDALEDSDSVLRAAADPKVKAVAESEMGLAHLQLRQYEQAGESYRNALRLNPAEGTALVGAGLVALRDGDFPRAVDEFSRAVRADPSDVKLLLLAQALRRAGQSVEAERAAVQARQVSTQVNQAQATAANYLALVGIKPM